LEERVKAEKLQEELKQKFIATKVANDEESQKHANEQAELNNLRKLKRRLL